MSPGPCMTLFTRDSKLLTNIKESIFIVVALKKESFCEVSWDPKHGQIKWTDNKSVAVPGNHVVILSPQPQPQE